MYYASTLISMKLKPAQVLMLEQHDYTVHTYLIQGLLCRDDVCFCQHLSVAGGDKLLDYHHAIILLCISHLAGADMQALYMPRKQQQQSNCITVEVRLTCSSVWASELVYKVIYQVWPCRVTAGIKLLQVCLCADNLGKV